MSRLAVIYCRISQDREGAGLGVACQEADCRALAAGKGWEVVAVHVDNDLDASTGRLRPGYVALLDDLRSGRATAVCCWHTDRLHRRPDELEDYIAVCEPRDVPTATVKAGPLDLTTAVGRMVARQHGAVARYEVEHMAERQRAARAQAATDGRWAGGRRPYGYQADGVTVIEEEAAEVRRAAAQVLAGASLAGLARDLNARGKPTATGRAWAATELKRVLLRPRNAALMVHRGQVVGAAGWSPLLEADTWRAVVAILTNPARRTNTSVTGRWLLSGLAVCGVCGAPVRSTAPGRSRGQPTKPTYVCRAKGCVVRDAAAADRHVAAVIVARLARPDAVKLLTPDRTAAVAALHTRDAALRARLDGLARAYAEEEIDARQLREGTATLRRRLAEVERRLAASRRSSALDGLVGVPDPAAVWVALPLARRRAVVAELAAVTILPARRGRRPGWQPGQGYFDPASVRVTPKRPA